MNWKTLEGFDEKLAKVSFKAHKTFDGKVVEVLYGAKDENGNFVLPKEDQNDGHGIWFGIETNGEYRMFSWRKPAYLGGCVEYGTSHNDTALEDMENDLRKKQELCRQAENISTVEEFEEIRKQFEAIENWNTPKDEEYAIWFGKTLEKFNARSERQSLNAEEKKKLIEKAASLADSTNWKETQAEFRNLQDEWETLGNAGVEDDSLWKQFKGYRNQFNDKRRNYFDNLTQVHAENEGKKLDLIKQAKELAKKTDNFRETSEKMNDLMDAWKAIGSAGRGKDDELWNEFNASRQGFYDERTAFFTERDEKQKESIRIKNALIEEAKTIASTKDYGREKTDRMKALDKEWRAAGYSGSDQNDALWETFTQAKEVFWNGKREDSQKRLQEAYDHKKSQLPIVREEINRLQEQEYETSDYERIRSIQRQVEEKKAFLEKLKSDIEDIEKKLNA